MALLTGVVVFWPRIAGADSGMTIESLNLEPTAERAARLLLQRHRDVIFTSGRRTLNEQANAMATNIHSDRRWIGRTYAQSEASLALQSWVDRHPHAVGHDAIAAGLLSTMQSMTPAVVSELSLHLSGLAFDIRPISGSKGEAVKASIRTLPGLAKFLDHEGGLARWHMQFHA